MPLLNDNNAPDDLEIERENAAKKDEQRKKTFNGLCASEWTMMSRSVWGDLSSTRASRHLTHGATYPEKLCERTISMYSKRGDLVLDPFLGTGTTVVSAVRNGRDAIGIELTEKYFDIASEHIKETFNSDQLSLNLSDEEISGSYELLKGDCCDELKKINADSIQLTMTSPPYADLIHKVVDDRKNRHKTSAFVVDNNATTNLYSDDSRDLGNMDIDTYTDKVQEIMTELFRVTKPCGYNVWVVKDFRDTRNNIPYVDLHSRIAAAGEKAGFKYHDLIIWDQNEQRRLVLLGYPSVFYVNQNHSFIVVLRKPCA